MTSWADIIVNHAMVEINDVRLDELRASNPAQFLRKMSMYCGMAIPLLNRPPELRHHIEYGMVEPQFGDIEWVTTEDSTTEEPEVATGITGCELFSCSLVEIDGAGNTYYTPYSDADYDADTGIVTMPVQSAAGLTYTMDFYRDGTFENDFTLTQKRLLGLAIAYVWYERERNNWLNQTPKIGDKSFAPKSEPPHIQAMTARVREVRSEFLSELRKYEQDCSYQNVVGGRTTGLV